MVDTQPTTTMSVSTTTPYFSPFTTDDWAVLVANEIMIKKHAGKPVVAPEEGAKFLIKVSRWHHEANFKGVIMALKLNGAGIKASLKSPSKKLG